MIELHIRPHLQKLFINPLIQRFNDATAITPNHITFVATGVGLCAALALFHGLPWLAVVLLWLSGYCDMLDGSLARLQQASSELGTVYDIMSDRFVECALILALVAVHPEQRVMVGMLMLASVLLCVTSFLVVGIFSDQQSEKSFYYSPGLVERAEAFIFFTLMIILPQYFTLLAVLFCALVCLTTVIRIREFALQVVA